MTLIAEFIAGRTPPELYQAYLSPLFESWADHLIEVLPPSGTAADLACGTGIVTRKIAKHGGANKVVGVDIAPPMIEAARSLSGADDRIQFIEGSAETLPFDAGACQSLYCQQGLQFFPDKLAALKEVARVMESGSCAAFSVWTSSGDGNPVFHAFEQIIAAELGSDLVPFGPFSFGRKEQIEELVAASGLEPLSFDKVEREARLPAARTLVLFDLLFLGRPAPDGTMHPLFDPDDASKDEQIAEIISALEEATRSFAGPTGELYAPSTAHVILLGKP